MGSAIARFRGCAASGIASFGPRLENPVDRSPGSASAQASSLLEQTRTMEASPLLNLLQNLVPALDPNTCAQYRLPILAAFWGTVS